MGRVSGGRVDVACGGSAPSGAAAWPCCPDRPSRLTRNLHGPSSCQISASCSRPSALSETLPIGAARELCARQTGSSVSMDAQGGGAAGPGGAQQPAGGAGAPPPLPGKAHLDFITAGAAADLDCHVPRGHLQAAEELAGDGRRLRPALLQPVQPHGARAPAAGGRRRRRRVAGERRRAHEQGMQPGHRWQRSACMHGMAGGRHSCMASYPLLPWTTNSPLLAASVSV